MRVSIPGYESYLIDANGDITSAKRRRLISKRISKLGYYMATLYRDKKPKTLLIHRLLAVSFIPNPKNLPQVNHKNGDKRDNRLVNLEWVTASQNIRHAHSMGLMNPQKGKSHWARRNPEKISRGENSTLAKLTENQVVYILKTYIPRDRNYSQRALAKRYGVSPGCITDIISRDNWRHVCV